MPADRMARDAAAMVADDTTRMPNEILKLMLRCVNIC